MGLGNKTKCWNWVVEAQAQSREGHLHSGKELRGSDHGQPCMWVLFSASCLLSPSRQESSVLRPGTAGSSGPCRRGHSINWFSSHPSSFSS